MGKAKAGCLIKLVPQTGLLVVIGLVFASCEKGTQQKPTSQPRLDTIHVSYKLGGRDEERQAIILTFTNSSDQAFTGTVDVTAVDFAGAPIEGGSDMWYFEKKPIHPDGGTARGILWSKHPERIGGIKSRASGSFQELPPRPGGLPYEEVGKLPIARIIFTPCRDRSVVEKIADGYAKRYGTGSTDIYFFDNLDYARKYLAVWLSDDPRAKALMSSETRNEVDTWLDSCFTTCTLNEGSWTMGAFTEKAKQSPKSQPDPVIEPVKRTPEEIANGLLGLACSYAASGIDSKARSIFERIIKEYPQTASAKKAEGELKKLK